MWLYAISRPPGAANLLADSLSRRDIAGELVYGASCADATEAGQGNTFGRLRPVRAPPPDRPTAHAASAGGEHPAVP
jgi:hypothetical protein